jgi:hypothetical protein
MKVISFSLWGNNPKYTIGAIKNAELIQYIYPGWVARFYIGSDVNRDIIKKLSDIPNIEIILKKDNNDWTGMFWRFEALCDDIEHLIFRDTDSRLNLREKSAVDAWLKSNKTFHIMRDHPFHRFPMLGGMWGVKKNQYNLCELLAGWQRDNSYGADYTFLHKKIFPIAINDSIIHDPFFINSPFPVERIGTEFVGDVFDEYDNRHPEFYKVIEKL